MLIQASAVFRIYVEPGTGDDGYVPPQWSIPLAPWAWEGGQGDWLYVGDGGSDPAADPARVYAFRYGSLEVERMRVLVASGEEKAQPLP